MIVKSLLPNTALLIFTRSASLEARQKPLAFRKKSAHKVAQLLNEKVVQIAEGTGLQYFVVNESLQRGVDFASRLDSAFCYIFEKGFQKVISIGNDCLGLTEAQILAAAADLEQQDFVIGPTQHGGLYLFGLNVDAYQYFDFHTLPWQTNDLYKHLREQLLAGSFKFKTYDSFWEVNHIYEWHAILQRVRHLRYLVALLMQLLSAPAKIISAYSASLILFSFPKTYLRGPPTLG